MFNTSKLILIFVILLTLIFTIIGCSNTDNKDIDNIEIETTEATVAIEQTESSDETICDTDETINETETTESAETTEEVEKIMYFTEEDVIAMAKVLYHECRGVPSTMQQACVAWTACNRVDAGYGDTIYSVLTAPHQFAYYENTPVVDELYDLALDVLTRWNDEKNGVENVGRVLPPEYKWFYGGGGHNHFRDGYKGKYNLWDYSLDNPYAD